MYFQWVKRILPFALALALGLFIASFFVTLTFPKIRKFERRYGHRQQYEMRLDKAERENDRLRRENERLNEELRRTETETNLVPLFLEERTISRKPR